jgi:hypothetical protein
LVRPHPSRVWAPFTDESDLRFVIRTISVEMVRDYAHMSAAVAMHRLGVSEWLSAVKATGALKGFSLSKMSAV